ncbi:hypothetical protein [Frankia nepalensis]|uniref:hypothetical protein n=1 Tax=Frankia nepalensis TaxID=1836974 RepID=UPI001932E1DF|nr:hypothetical protein [Frankia nepalensis]MBL7513253.1 hypothetical protein [Frankia nepalensis]
MAFDVDGYRARVVDPARRSGVPADPFLRYALDDVTATSPVRFSARVDEVVRYWRTLQLKKTYATVADALLAAHAQLEAEGRLTPAFFRQERDRLRKTESDRLDRLVRSLAAAGPCVTEAMVDALVADVAGVFDRAAVLAALGRHRVRLVQPGWVVPDGPPTPRARSLRVPLGTLGLRLSADLVLGVDEVRAGFHLRGGFRLAARGESVTQPRVDAARRARAGSPQDERKTAAENVFAIVAAATRGGPGLDYDALVRWEVAEALRGRVAAGWPAPAVADEAVALGLVRAEADEFAVLLVEAARAARTGGDPLQEVHEALAGGQLRLAARLLAAVPAADGGDQLVELRTRIASAVARVDRLARDAGRASAAGRSEAAAELLAEAVEIAADDEDLADRLRAIPPPPPTDVVAAVDGGRVTVRWAPSAARTGQVTYRLVRVATGAAASPESADRVADTRANTAVDPDPPLGEPARYAVFACRKDGIWSADASAAPVLLVPDVEELTVAATDRSVRGSWRAHPAVREVAVVRPGEPAGPRAAPGPRPASPVLVRASPAGFEDVDVRRDTTYEYTVRAVYLGRDGTRRQSPGRVALARPQRPPEPVRDLVVDLRAEPRGDGPAAVTAVASWTPPRAGAVEIRLAGSAPAWTVGDQVPADRAGRHGMVAPGSPTRRPDGRVALRIDPRRGRCYVTALTAVPAGATVAVGNTVPVSLVDAVTALVATRFGDTVRLRWDWPEGAGLARVEWWPTGAPGPAAGGLDGRAGPAGGGLVGGGRVDLRLRRYVDDGGAEITVGPGAVTISVRTVAGADGTETASPAVTVAVPGRAIEVTYTVRQAGLPGRRRLVVTLTPEATCRLPPLVVVGRPDGILPLDASRGTVVAALAARDVVARQPVDIPLEAAWKSPPGLACFVDGGAAPDPEAARVTLVRSRGMR